MKSCTYLLIYRLETLNMYFRKQWRSRWNATQCDISLGSAQFARTKSIFRERNTIFFGNYILWPLNIYNGLSWLYCYNVCSFMDQSIGLKRVNLFTYLCLLNLLFQTSNINSIIWVEKNIIKNKLEFKEYEYTVKTSVKQPLKNRQNKDLNYKWPLNEVKSIAECWKHSAILLTCIK